MCGIVGVFALNKTDLEIDSNLRRRVALFLHNEILFETIARGKDATGISVSLGQPFNKTEKVPPYWHVIKQPVDTEDFFLNDGTSARYDGQDENANIERCMDVATMLQRPLQHIIGHTRARTVGSEFNPNNNHPIIVGKIIGIHNGGVKNYKKIYEMHKEMTPQGEVDSEIIMQLLAKNANDRALDAQDIKYVSERIVGPRAVIAYNSSYPEKVIYFHDKERPLELAYIPELGLAIICSERRFFNTAMHVYRRTALTIKRNLPDLTVEWRTVPAGKGGVIDISDEFAGDCEADTLFPLIDCSTVKTAYATYTPIKVNHAHKPHVATYVNTQKEKAKTNTANKNVPSAKIVDVSSLGYGADKDVTEDNSEEQVTSIVAEAIFGDQGESDEEDINVIDMYSHDDLVKKGIEYVLSSAGQKDNNLLVNKHSGSFKKMLCKPMSEADATEVVNQIYPEALGDGVALGYKWGSEDQRSLQSDSAAVAMSDKLEEMEQELLQLQKEVDLGKENAKKSSGYIANMKAFLMAAIITNDLGRVEGSGATLELVFDDDLEQFLGTARGFTKADPELVRGIFSGRDLQSISESMVLLAKEVAKETKSKSTSKKKV